MTPAETNTQSAKTTLWRLALYAKPYLGLIAVALLFTLLFSGAEALRNYLVKPLIDDVLIPAKSALQAEPGLNFLDRFGLGSSESAEKLEEKLSPTPEAPSATEATSPASDATALQRQIEEGLLEILLKAFLVILIVPLALFGKEYFVEYTLGRVRLDIQQQICDKLLTLPLAFHHGTTRGDTLSRIMNDVGRARTALRLLFGEVFQSALRGIFCVGVMFYISWQLTLACTVLAPILIGVVSYFGKRIREGSRLRQEKLGDIVQRLMEILNGVKVIKAFRGENIESASFAKENRKLFRRTMRVIVSRILSRSILEMLTHATAIAVLLLGGALVLKGTTSMSLGDIVWFFVMLQGTYRPTKMVTKGWNGIMDTLPAAERFMQLLDAPDELADAENVVELEDVRESIVFENVSFSYGRQPVLNDISFTIRAGEVVAFVGRTGAGKTTLADLLLRFYDPDRGSIKIDGLDLRKIKRSSLLDHMAVVNQNPFLFAGNIHDNIRYGRPEASEAEILAAAESAHVASFIEELPDGYNTEVGEIGEQLSGGQRQRITIARALLKNPKILIFDEATSSLDSKSERHVQEAIETLMHNRTVFIIAHRFSTIRNADKIIVLEEGTITQIGTHEELIAQGGLYNELAMMQNTGKSEISTNAK